MNVSDAPDSVLVPTGRRPLTKWTDDPLSHIKFDTTVMDGKVAVITLSRPKSRNAWTEIMRNEIIHCVEKASRMSKIRVIILTGDPEGKCFCAGADLAPASPTNPNTIEGDVPKGRPANITYWRDGGGQAALSIVRSTKPVIAAVNGNAVGVGMTLPLSCDMTVAAEDAKCGFVFTKRGLTIECLSTYFLKQCVGQKKAMELSLTGRVFKAQDAPSGLFNYVVPKDQVMNKALELAAEICETSPMSAMLNRHMINRPESNPEEAHLLESKAIYWVSNQADAREGINSFLEKRKAEYPMDPFKDSPEWFPYG